MTARDIPGFFYDEERKRYFAIQSHPTARPDAEYAVANVKKRKAKRVEVEAKRKRQDQLVERSRILAHPLAGGRLLREFGALDPELPVENWAAGLRYRGQVSFLPGRERHPDAPSISCLLVEGGDEAAGVGMAYAGVDGERLLGCYLPTDKDENINYAITNSTRASRLAAVRTEEVNRDVTALAYHQASHHVVAASTDYNDLTMRSSGKIMLFRPQRPSDYWATDIRSYSLREYGGALPSWMLGDTSAYVSYTPPAGPGLMINAITACPSSTSGPALDALIATSQGIMAVGAGAAEREIAWVTPPPRSHPRTAPQERRRGGRHYRRQEQPAETDALSVEYHPSSPRVCYAGCRTSKVIRLDFRAPPRPREHSDGEGLDILFQHRSSAAHVRCIDDHRVLVAGPQNSMAVYDARWFKPRKGGGERDDSEDNRDNIASSRNTNFQGRQHRHEKKFAAQPVVVFPGYSNHAHVRIGLDVTHDAGGGLGGGVVAAGMNDGTVAIFSLRTGRKLRSGDVGGVKAPGSGVVKALQFKKFPWEKEASLFIGDGPVVKKFTFGPDEGEDEW